MLSFGLSIILTRHLLLVEIWLVNLYVVQIFVLVLNVTVLIGHDRITSHLIGFDLFSHFNIFGFILEKFSWENWLTYNGSLPDRTFRFVI